MAGNQQKRKADLKVVILGSALVGKTTFIDRYITGTFKDTISTIGASFSLKQFNGYNIAIWDTAGEERFSGLSNFYSRNAGAAILAFDLTDPASFHALQSRFLPLVDAAEENCLLVVVGMKSDKVTRETRPVPPEQPMLLAQRINKRKLDKVPYFEASSLAGLNVEEVFNFIFHTCLPLSKKEDLTRTASASSGVVNLSDSIPPKKGQDPPMARNKSSCC